MGRTFCFPETRSYLTGGWDGRVIRMLITGSICHHSRSWMVLHSMLRRCAGTCCFPAAGTTFPVCRLLLPDTATACMGVHLSQCREGAGPNTIALANLFVFL